jgi:hypothetical protein
MALNSDTLTNGAEIIVDNVVHTYNAAKNRLEGSGNALIPSDGGYLSDDSHIQRPTDIDISVASFVASLPVSPADKQRHILTAVVGGVGIENDIIRYNAATALWEVSTPIEGTVVFLKDTDRIMGYDGSAWIVLGPTPQNAVVADGDYGDIVVSASGATMTLHLNVITAAGDNTDEDLDLNPKGAGRVTIEGDNALSAGNIGTEIAALTTDSSPAPTDYVVTSTGKKVALSHFGVT